jgi:RNA polymerase sigma factor (sigma-70 family)
MTPLFAPRPRVDRSFERLYRRHVGDVYHYALAVLRNPADAEDVTQTTFMNAYGAYRRGERPVAPRNWLMAIAHNVCRQRFRQAARRPQEVGLDEDVGETLVADDGPTAGEIRNALSHLAFNQRAALVMRELEGRSYAEIAERLELSVAAVETLIFRARRALREQLEGALTCKEAELAVSKQVDGLLPRRERGPLRAHLRQCPDCATFARSQRAQRAAMRAIATIPLPASLASFFGGGGAAVGTGVAAKAAFVVAAGVLVGGTSYEGAKRLPIGGGEPSSPASASPRNAAPARRDDAGAPVASRVSRSVVPSTTATERGSVRAEPGGQGAKGRGAEQKASSEAGAAGGRPEAPPGRTKPRPSLGRGTAAAKPVKAKATGNGRAVGHDRPKAKGRGGAQDPAGKGTPPGKGKKTGPVPDVPAPTKPKK